MKNEVFEKADLELGNLMLNPNYNQVYTCPSYIQALLRELRRQLQGVMSYKEHKEYDNPFDNTGNTFKNDVFEVQAYNWNDDIHQSYNFKWNDIEISWYKYLGRDTTINREITEKEAREMYDACLQSIWAMEDTE